MAFFLAGEILSLKLKLKSQYPGSVVPLAMFVSMIDDIHLVVNGEY